jgi:hypothetical protein
MRGETAFLPQATVVSFFTHHRSVPLRTLAVSTDPIVLPAAVASKMTNARLSLHAFEDEYDNPGDSVDSEADPVVAADLIVPSSMIAPIDHVLDVVAQDGTDDRLVSVQPASKPHKASKHMKKFPWLAPMNKSASFVHASSVTSKFFNMLRGALYAEKSANRLQRVRSTLLRNDPHPPNSIHEYAFVVVKTLDPAGSAAPVFQVARVQAALSWQSRAGGPRSIGWPLSRAGSIAAHDRCQARLLMFNRRPAETIGANIVFAESFEHRMFSVDADNIVALLKQTTQFAYDARTHDVVISSEVWTGLTLHALASSPVVTTPVAAVSTSESTGMAPASATQTDVAASASSAASVASGDAANGAPVQVTSRKRGRSQLTLAASDVDQGFSIIDFWVGQDVLVFFKNTVIGGKIQRRSTRGGTCVVELDTDMYDQMITVSCKCLAPLNDFDHDHEDASSSA